MKAAHPRDKPYKLYHENRLFLYVAPTGSRLWRYKYTHAGVEKLISLGIYPDVKLKDDAGVGRLPWRVTGKGARKVTVGHRSVSQR